MNKQPRIIACNSNRNKRTHSISSFEVLDIAPVTEFIVQLNLSEAPRRDEDAASCQKKPQAWKRRKCNHVDEVTGRFAVMNRRQSSLILHMIVLIFGFTGILGKLISLDAERLVFWRVFLGGSLVMLWLLFRGKTVRFKPKTAVQVAFVGCVAAGHWIAFFAAIKVSNVSIALATLATTPLFVSFIEPLVHRRKLDWREMALGLVILVGLLVLLMGPKVTNGGFALDASDYYWGVSLALVSAFLAGVFSTLNSVLVRQYDASNLTRLELLSAAAVLAVVFLLQPKGRSLDFWTVPTSDWLWLGLLASVATAFAFLMSIEVMRKLSPFTTAVAINMEPVYAILFASWIFGEEEQMGPWFYAGTVIIVGAVFVDAALKRRAAKGIQTS
jgi:drug/metabolite transporter (DMT)-like permease